VKRKTEDKYNVPIVEIQKWEYKQIQLWLN